MPDQFILTCILKPAIPFGFTIFPYSCSKVEGKYLVIQERISKINLGNYEFNHDLLAELVELSASLEPTFMVAKFSKKKMPPGDFFRKSDKALHEQVIRPYFDKAIYRIVRLLQQHQIPFYDGKAMPNLYPADLISVYAADAAPRLRFRRSDSGTIYTFEAFLGKNKVNLQHRDNIILSHNPCVYISEKQLFTFDQSINGKLLGPFLKKESIEIPPRVEAKYFSTFIHRIVGRCEIEAEGFEVRNVSIEPEALLSVEYDWQGKPSLVLNFRYGEKLLSVNNVQKTFISLVAGENGFVFTRFVRNMAIESERLMQLKSLGLTQYESLFRLVDENGRSTIYTLVEWLIGHFEQLRQTGFTINQPEETRFALVKGNLSISSKAGQDWFDVNAMVKCGEFEIPFIHFREHILNGSREFVLPSGEVFLIPEEWFSLYHDFMVYSTNHHGIPRIRKHHFMLLKAFQLPDFNLLAENQIHDSIQLPGLQNAILRPYQAYGFFRLKKLFSLGFGAILADDMGLGKTLQTIALLLSYYRVEGNKVLLPDPEPKQQTGTGVQLDLFSQELPAGPVQATDHKKTMAGKYQKLPCTLVVMPTSLIHNWMHELQRFAPHLKVYNYTGSMRSLSQRVLTKYQVILTTYGTMRNDIDKLSEIGFHTVVLDESQQIRNSASLVAKAAFRLNSDYRLALSGTPVENSLNDLWSQMNFVNPGLLGSLKDFNRFYQVPLSQQPDGETAEKLRELIQPFILRRTKEEVAPELPKIIDTIAWCSMSDDQQVVYETEKSKIRNEILSIIPKAGLSKSVPVVLRALMRLRQIASHPRMFDPGYQSDSGKFDDVTSKLETILSENHKVLVFSSFVKHLAIFESWCQEREIEYALLTGATGKREEVINRFRKNTGVRLFLISLKAGGVGLNLTEADYVFILDPWWNPAAEMQAISRAHRIGQDKSVFVYRFISSGSIEEKIMKLQERKSNLAEAFVRSDSTMAGMSSGEVMDLFD
ncbi:MAG: DEAD/DEAH box helicase [Lentimicrobium sp.]